MLSEAEREEQHEMVAGAMREVISISAEGGPARAAEMIGAILATVSGSAVRFLGRERARELLEMQLTAIERGGAL
jgi:hypothetical protein